MIYFIEGARNSGKSYISKEISNLPGFRYFQYRFADWFSNLKLSDTSRETHSFAMGKETMLLQLINDGAISHNYLIDRGIFSVLTWGVMEGRIRKGEAINQLNAIIDMGLLSKCQFLYIYGNNPDGERGNKDRWDNKDKTRKDEANWMEFFMNFAESKDPSIKIHRIENSFNSEGIERVKKLIK